MKNNLNRAEVLFRRPIYPLMGLVLLGAVSIPVAASAQGGPGANPERRAIIQSLSEEERQKFFAMSREEKRAFMQEQLKKKSCRGRARPEGFRTGAATGTRCQAGF